MRNSRHCWRPPISSLERRLARLERRTDPPRPNPLAEAIERAWWESGFTAAPDTPEGRAQWEAQVARSQADLLDRGAAFSALREAHPTRSLRELIEEVYGV
jgi:hypothetical protein